MKRIASIFYNYQEERVRALWRILLHIVIMGAITGILSLPFIINENMNGLGIATIIMMIGVTAATLIAGLLLDKRKFIDFGFKINSNWLKDLFFGFILGGVLMLLVFLSQLWTGQISVESVNFSLSSLWPLSVGLGIFMLVGFYEELLSRGYHLINITEGIYHPSIGIQLAVYFAVIISSSVFGIGHLGNPGATWVSTVNIILAGVLLAVGMVFTKQLGISIGLHISWNFFQGNIFGFAVSGTTVNFSLINIRTTGSELFTGGAFGPEAGLVGVFAMLMGIALILFYIKARYGRLDLNIWMENVTKRINKPIDPEHNSGIMS
ncbi:MAG TPA: type II CAAX endopeptidase family protein [Ignavibacteriales bacterium]|nr:type II CAAX endopeptidase family protein [Ignavibacteriales bacterium]